MEFKELFIINKFIKKSIYINSPVIESLEFDVKNRITNINLYNVNKLQTTLVINTMIVFFLGSNWRTNILNDIVCVDFLSQLKNNEYKDGFRFFLKYCFTSLSDQSRVNFYIKLRKNNNFFSLEKLFSSSIWLQREIWDMYGIIFQGASDLRRILTDYGFSSFPLRVDFPVFGNREIYYDSELSELLFRKVDAAQENRFFGYKQNSFWF